MENSKSKGRPTRKDVMTWELKAIRQYFEEGLSDEEIGLKLGRSKSSIQNIMLRYKIRKPQYDYRHCKIRGMTSQQLDELIQDWIEFEHMNAVHISRRLKALYPPGISPQSVSLRINKLPMRYIQLYYQNLYERKGNASRRTGKRYSKVRPRNPNGTYKGRSNADQAPDKQ